MSDEHYFQEELDEAIGEDVGDMNNIEIESEISPSLGLRGGRGVEENAGIDYMNGHESPTGTSLNIHKYICSLNNY